MLKDWYKNYADLMYRTSFISKFGALCIFLPSVTEIVRVIQIYRATEDISFEAVRYAFLLPLLLAIVLGARFFLLMTQRTPRPVVNAFTWLCGMAAAYFYSAQFYLPAFWRDESGFSRGMHNPFSNPLLILALLFMFFSIIRLCITTLSAFADRGVSLETGK